MSDRRRRDSTEIKYDILNSALHGDGKTHIMYATGLNLRQLNTYITDLMASGGLEFRPVERRYITTEKGKAFAKAFEHYRETMDLLARQEAALASFFPTTVNRTLVVRP
jgi:predicted transcriptional regulator